jgi:hypothetical protein
MTTTRQDADPTRPQSASVATIACAYCPNAIPAASFAYVSAAKSTLSAACPYCDRRTTLATATWREWARASARPGDTFAASLASIESIWALEKLEVDVESGAADAARFLDRRRHGNARPSSHIEVDSNALPSLESLARDAIDAALARDIAAVARDRAARLRDEDADRRDLNAAGAVHDGQLPADRDAAARDRWAAAVDRESAARDRDLAASDQALLLTHVGSAPRRRAVAFEIDDAAPLSEDV